MFSSNFIRSKDCYSFGKEISLTQITPLYFYSFFVLLTFFPFGCFVTGFYHVSRISCKSLTQFMLASRLTSIVNLIQPSISLEESLNRNCLCWVDLWVCLCRLFYINWCCMTTSLWVAPFLGRGSWMSGKDRCLARCSVALTLVNNGKTVHSAIALAS